MSIAILHFFAFFPLFCIFYIDSHPKIDYNHIMKSFFIVRKKNIKVKKTLLKAFRAIGSDAAPTTCAPPEPARASNIFSHFFAY